jgi:hypothetical protein
MRDVDVPAARACYAEADRCKELDGESWKVAAYRIDAGVDLARRWRICSVADVRRATVTMPSVRERGSSSAGGMPPPRLPAWDDVQDQSHR